MELITVKVNGVKLDCYYSYDVKSKNLILISVESETDTQDLIPLLELRMLNEVKSEILKHINGEK
jgi:hypothetical protein